ncbi:hypothetical protein FBU31_004113 [Coemansia sp. 'formosensis']|nr:hypothetical protein FBU31_004113 [Coemansia sp. 'formosensis']
MVSLTAYAASLAALLSAVNAGFYTTYPIGADAVKPGQTISIQWRPDTSAPDLSNVAKYTLKFMTGGNIVQTTVATIGEFDITTTTIPFTIPQTAPGMYFLMYTASNGAGSSWSTRFSVGGGTTWYPAGVATGVDPGTSDTAIDTPIVISASSSAVSSSSTASSSNPITSTSLTLTDSSSSTRTSTTSPAGPNTSAEAGSQSSTSDGNPASPSSNPNPNPQPSTTPIQDTTDPISPPSNPGNTAQTSGTDMANTGSSSTGSSSTGSSSKSHRSSSESSESSSDSTSQSNGAAARYLSAAALVVAAVIAW